MLLDKIIGIFSPAVELGRVKHRRAIEILQERKFEGASVGRRTREWRTSSTSANAAKSGQINRLRDRSRDLIRNNSYAKKGQAVVTNNVVGKGIMANIKTGSDETDTKIQTVWDDWIKSPKAVDYEGKLDFNSLTRLCMSSIFESGEVLVRRRRTEDGIGIKLQILEADHLVNDQAFQESPDTGNRIVQGIEIDETGAAVAYHLHKNHPGNLAVETKNISSVFDTVRVPATDIIHIYRKERPGELRGVPWLAPVIIKLRELDEFEDAMLVRQKVAAMYAGFIHDLGTPDGDLFDVDEKTGEKLDKLEPGMIVHLPAGKDIKFGSPPLPQAEAYKFYISSHLHGVSSGLGITYESLTGDLSEVNFSSARMGRLDMNENVDGWRLSMIIPMFLNPVFDWFLEAIEIQGEEIGSIRAGWVPPKAVIIDPTKEIPAQIRAVRGGLVTLSDAIRQSGKDPDDHFKELAADAAMLDSLGLILDTDPRKTTAAGMFQIDEDESTEGPTNEN